MKLLILGGYGVFGGRLAELLNDLDGFEIIIAGRNGTKASAFCNAYIGKTTVIPLEVDRADIKSALTTHHPDILIDASGPFQLYGGDPYAVLKTCIEHRVHYLDFADAADFVFGISQFDSAATEAGIFALSGVSSFPVLTAAVVRALSKDMEIEKLTGGIAPSPYAGIGLNVMRAVVGYAGGPVKLRRNGTEHIAKGLTESMRYTIATPGQIPLRNIRFSLVDVPDLQVIPPNYPNMHDIWMGAGPVPESLHRLLNLLAKLRAALKLPAFTPFSGLFYSVLNLMKFGEHRGGMFVHATGTKNGQHFEKSWHMTGEGDDGPYIPSMAIEAIIRKAINGSAPKIGARPATTALELSDYQALFKHRQIFDGFRSPPSLDATLYQKILGDSFADLPEHVREIHSQKEPSTWTGKSKITPATRFFAKLTARILGFPHKEAVCDTTVTFTPSVTGEHWQRNFAGHKFTTYQSLGTGKYAHLLKEKFGFISVYLAIAIQDDTLTLTPRNWSIMGIPLPQMLLPKGNTFESNADGKFNFHVEVVAPIIGHIVGYEGWLVKVPSK